MIQSIHWFTTSCIFVKLPQYPTIIRDELHALERTELLTTNTFIIINNPNNIYLLLNQTRHPSSQYNHPTKSLLLTLYRPSEPSPIKLVFKKLENIQICWKTMKYINLPKEAPEDPTWLSTPFTVWDTKYSSHLSIPHPPSMMALSATSRATWKKMNLYLQVHTHM